MSQINFYGITGGGGTGPVLSLTGNSGGAVFPTAGGTINTVFDTQSTTLPPSGFTAIGNQVANTLTLEQFLYSAVTIGATTTTIFSLPLTVNQAAVVNADIVALRSDSLYAGIGRVFAGGHRAAGASTVIIPIFTDFNDDDPSLAALLVGFVASGNNLEITVSGIAATTYNWSAYVRYHTQP